MAIISLLPMASGVVSHSHTGDWRSYFCDCSDGVTKVIVISCHASHRCCQLLVLMWLMLRWQLQDGCVE